MHGAAVPGAAPAPGTDHRVVVNDSTKYHSHGYQGTLADLRVGYRINANGAINGEDLVADNVEFMPAMAEGTVTGIDTASGSTVITVKTVRQLTLHLQPSEATAVWVKPRVAPNKKGTMEDVKVGSPVNVGFHPTEGGPAPLLWIAVFTGI